MNYKEKTRSRIYADLFISKKIYTYFKNFGYINDSCTNICKDIELLFSSNTIDEIYTLEIFNKVFKNYNHPFNENKDAIKDPLCFQLIPSITNSNPMILVYYLDLDCLRCCTQTVKNSDYYEYKKLVSLEIEKNKNI